MSLLPRRGPGRHGQPGSVAVHPGWTLTPTSVTDAVQEPATPAEPIVAQPTSRWTPAPALPPVATAVAPVVAPVEPVVEHVVQPVVAPVVQPVAAPVVPPVSNWASEWEAIASTPAAGSAPSPLHTAAVSALDAVFGAAAAPATWGAAPLDPRTVAPVPSSPLSALDRPLGAISEEVATPLAIEAARALPSAQPVAVVVPKPLPPRSTPPSMPPPPSTPPPPRLVQVPAPAQQLVERAIRTAPAAPVQRRSTVRLGFTDASVIDLRPEDPIAKALHTVAQALMERDHA